MVGERSLVLIDEIGDGTDPEEGSAIAEAVLDDLIRRCGRTIVTTHFRSLKGWAHNTRGAENATLEFDPDNLEPLFGLKMGIPGRSWGIEMSGRFGLPEEIVERAKSGMGDHALRLEELLAHLEKALKMVGDEREELLKKERMLAELTESYRDRLDRFRESKDELVQKAREDALEIVTATRKEMEHIIQEIRTKQAESTVIRRAKDRVQKRKSEFEHKIGERKSARSIDIENLEPGMWVEVVSLGHVGKVLSIGDSSKVHLELRGGLRVETRVEDLAPTEEVHEYPPQRQVSWRTDDFETVTCELMVRGMEREDALREVDAFVDKAVLQGLRTVTVIHGVGKGILKRAIYDMLKADPRVKDVRPGEPALGGDGVAVVELK
jgi:DNA mismatch repair protein MutS2